MGVHLPTDPWPFWLKGSGLSAPSERAAAAMIIKLEKVAADAEMVLAVASHIVGWICGSFVMSTLKAAARRAAADKMVADKAAADKAATGKAAADKAAAD